MSDLLRPLRINAVELLRQPGAVRDVDVRIEAARSMPQHERLDGDVDVKVRLEALHDGIAVTGTVSADWSTVCRRCLAPISGRSIGVVDEMYRLDELDDEAYVIEDGQLDLAPMVREVILLELDLERVCRDDCAGLCPECGVDRNTTPCDCDTTVTDERWSALEGFVPDDD